MFACAEKSVEDTATDDAGTTTETTTSPMVDADEDGIPVDEDCDDTDAMLGARFDDADCDGVSTTEDCDDEDATVGSSANDADCDGVSTTEDCDDADSAVGSSADDADCDDVSTTEDCDDTDPAVGSSADDADCDGVWSAEDCDDADPAAGSSADDADCDGVATAIDCDDDDPAVTIEVSHPDCVGDYYRLIGVDPTDRAGTAIASAGDVDGDGRDDILVGAPNSDDAVCGGDFSGEAFLVLSSDLGRDRDIILSDAAWSFFPDEEYHGTGYMLASAGDVDGDGLDDVLIGAPYGGSDSEGKAYLVLASQLTGTGAFNLNDAAYTFMGEGLMHQAAPIGSAGDIDGDGRADLWFKASDGTNGWAAGAVYVVLASELGSPGIYSLADASHKLLGMSAGDGLGAGAAVGDIDGDGLDDLLVAAPAVSDTVSRGGRVYLVPGQNLTGGVQDVADAASHTFSGQSADAFIGHSVSALGDIDGDGLGDFSMTSPNHVASSGTTGGVFIVLSSQLGSPGEFDLTGAAHTLEGDVTNVLTAATSGGDLNGDGTTDLLMGFPIDSTAGLYTGMVKVISGTDLVSDTIQTPLTMAGRQFYGEEERYYIGQTIAPAGDVNGDGVDDFLTSADTATIYTPEDGVTYIVLGRP